MFRTCYAFAFLMSCCFSSVALSQGTMTTENVAFQAYLQEQNVLASVIESEGLVDLSKLELKVDRQQSELVVEHYFRVFGKNAVKPHDIKKYYDDNLGEYSSSKARFAHIYVGKVKDAKPGKQKTKTVIDEVVDRLASGESFSKLAKKYSDDTISALKGGDLGWVDPDIFGPQVSKAVLDLQPGEVSKPIKTSEGTHIIKLIDAPKILTRSFGVVRESIREKLLEQKIADEKVRLLSLAGK